MPRHRGVIRPRGSIAVASANTKPTPPRANVLKCAKCQLDANPVFAEYMHKGESTTRFGSVTPRMAKGEKSSVSLVMGIFLNVILTMMGF
jgi:hypothetical protein